MKIVKDLLYRKVDHNNFIHPNALVIDALKKLDEINLSYLIVTDGEEILGIFSERDYARKVILKGRSSSETPVKDVMTIDLPKVTKADSVENCMGLLAAQSMRYVLVMEDAKCIGVITIHDLLREVLFNREQVFDDHVTSKLLDINERPARVY